MRRRKKRSAVGVRREDQVVLPLHGEDRNLASTLAALVVPFFRGVVLQELDAFHHRKKFVWKELWIRLTRLVLQLHNKNQPGRLASIGPDGAQIIERLHQEELCQAPGIVSEQKYQKEGGPSLKQCFDLMRSVSRAPVLDLRRCLMQ